jgi:hypothetical protein
MQAVIGESVQSMLLPGEHVDTYYAGVSNTEKQAFPSRVQNKFYVDLNSKTAGGTSVVTFNPNQGVTDIVLELEIPDMSAIAGLQLAQSWGYRAIASMSFRYGTAPQYFVTGNQNFISVLASCEDTGKKQIIAELGGVACVQPSDFADPTNRKAYVYLKLPHNTPNSKKHLPYTSDLTTQPLQITIELLDWAKLFGGSVAARAAAAALGSPGFTNARVNFKQVELNNAGDLLAHRENMTEKMYVYPLHRFEQRELQIPLKGDGSQQSVQLTGFRSGEVTNIVMWALDNGDLSGNWFNFQPISNTVLTINGDIRYDARDTSSVLWDALENPTPSAVSQVIVNGTNAPTASSAYWLNIPMGQRASVLGNEYELNHGYSVMNSVLNLQLQLPVSANGYTLYVTYWYNSSLTIHNGNVDYAF